MLPISDYKHKNIVREQFNFAGKVTVKLLVVISILVGSLFVSQLVFANNLATDGQKLSNVDVEIQKLEAENTTLKVQIASVSSFVNLSKKAQELGFAKPSKQIAL